MKIRIVLYIGILLLAVSAASAQTAGAANVVNQVSAAFSGAQAVQQIQLTGNATWYTGSQEDSGSVTLTATSNGSSQMQLELGSAGQRTESQTGLGLSANCQWAGADGVAHPIRSGACWRPALWFLPAFSFQPSQLSENLTATDLGTGMVGAGDTPLRHFQSQLTLTNAPASLAADVAQWSKTEIGLDPATLLPAVMTYSVRPDNGAAVAVAIEIRYSNYRAVDGVQIPFLIERYVNGTLQLQIQLSAAQIN